MALDAEDLAQLRGKVRKHLPCFIEYVKEYGSATVKEVLLKGHSGKIKLTVDFNRKDRYQMMQMLDLV